MGFIPAATDLHPSLKMARVRTVAVVVPAKQSGGLLVQRIRRW